MTAEIILTDEQIRQAVQCLTAEMSLDGETLHLKNVNGCIRAIEQAVLAKLAEQATEAYPCRIVEADFETNTVTLEMQGKYTVSSGQKYLCDVPLYRCPVPSSQGSLDNSNHIPHTGKIIKSLRDEFAMAALTGLLSNSGGPIQISSQRGWSLVNCTLDDVSSFAYEMADAMLAAAPKYKGGSNE